MTFCCTRTWSPHSTHSRPSFYPTLDHPPPSPNVMGVVCRPDFGVSLRIQCIVRSASRHSSVEPKDVSTKPLKTRRKLTPRRRESPLATPRPCNRVPVSFISIQGTVFEVPKDLATQMTKHTTQQMKNSLIGECKATPIHLNDITIPQFQSLLYAYTVYPATDLPWEHVLSIAEMAHRFELSDLGAWSIETMASLCIPTANSPLRAASNEIYLRALRLAMIYGRADISSSIQAKWLTRILWHELSPVPALLFADKYEFRSLSSHAYYTHMVELGARVIDPNFLPSSSSLLNRKQKTHLLAGYHSLSVSWKRIREKPPAFQQAPQCKLHKQCCAAWGIRWSVACSRPSSIPEVDVLRRLRYVEELLKDDALLKVCLAPKCQAAALESISQTRTDISNNLHHHFDLP